MPLAMGSALRDIFGQTLAELASGDPRILVLDGDVGSSTGVQPFEAAHPDLFLQMGVTEQNMLGVAAGLATLGFVPFVSAFACFSVARALDSVRVLIAQPGLNVKITGAYAGLLAGMTGKTHQMFNDLAIMRSLGNMTVLAPADEIEARQMIAVVARTPGPVYMQITRDPSPVLFGPDYVFELGQAVTVRDGSDVTLVSTGVQTVRTFEAAEILAAEGIEALVLHMPTIKPIDAEMLVRAAAVTGLVITVEEHTVIGGLGGAVAEVLSEQYPVPVRRLGIRDTYGESGPNEKLLDKYRLSAGVVACDIAAIVREQPSPWPSAVGLSHARRAVPNTPTDQQVRAVSLAQQASPDFQAFGGS
jgi:transketolase